jgi:hypothetical protein
MIITNETRRQTEYTNALLGEISELLNVKAGGVCN